MKYTILAIAGVVLSSLRILGKAADHNKPQRECDHRYGSAMIPCEVDTTGLEMEMQKGDEAYNNWVMQNERGMPDDRSGWSDFNS